jgi:hypothetical protein
VFLVFCLGLELTLRATHLFGARTSWTEPDPLIGWRYVAGAEYWFLKENDHPVTGRINSFGWRDYERRIKKPEGAYRVAVLGDSYVAAFHVELESTFVSLAEDLLTRDFGLNVELMNFGRQGMTQTEELAILRRDVLPFSPDMVALLFLPLNDIRDISRATALDAVRPFAEAEEGAEPALETDFDRSLRYKLRASLSAVRRRSALVSLVAERYTTFRRTRALARRDAALARRDADPKTPGGLPGHITLCTENPHPVYAANYRLNKRLIASMAEICRARDIEFLLMCSDLMTGPENEERYRSIDSTFDVGFFDRDLGGMADSLGIHYLGLQRPFSVAAEETGRSLHWVHWNYDGHRVAAEALALRLRDLLGKNERRL